MRYPTVHAAVFAIIRNENQQILFSKRYNTWHLDGYFSLPAWHVEDRESITDAMIRELKEELWIIVIELKMVFSQQSIHIDDGRMYCNFFFEITQYSGHIQNMEREKCSELTYIDDAVFWERKIAPYVQDALSHIHSWEIFSEILWKEYILT